MLLLCADVATVARKWTFSSDISFGGSLLSGKMTRNKSLIRILVAYWHVDGRSVCEPDIPHCRPVDMPVLAADDRSFFFLRTSATTLLRYLPIRISRSALQYLSERRIFLDQIKYNKLALFVLQSNSISLFINSLLCTKLDKNKV